MLSARAAPRFHAWFQRILAESRQGSVKFGCSLGARYQVDFCGQQEPVFGLDTMGFFLCL
jgi:hypothetical protein